ncbi:MAG: sigma-70 family RNA polymerase sigma factor [bacterium]
MKKNIVIIDGLLKKFYDNELSLSEDNSKFLTNFCYFLKAEEYDLNNYNAAFFLKRNSKLLNVVKYNYDLYLDDPEFFSKNYEIVADILKFFEAYENIKNQSLINNDTIETKTDELFMKYNSTTDLERKKIKNQIIDLNTGLVIHVVNTYFYGKRNLEYKDLIQEGCIGLINAVNNFDPTVGVKFSSYASISIKNKIITALYQYGECIKLPSNAISCHNSISTAQEEYFNENNTLPTLKELASITGYSEKVIERNINFKSIVGDGKVDSLENLIEEKDDKLNTLIEGNNELEKVELREDIDIFLNSGVLSEKETLILKYYYGFFGNVTYDFPQISEIVGLSKQRVFQIAKKALSKLRNSKNALDIKDYHYIPETYLTVYETFEEFDRDIIDNVINKLSNSKRINFFKVFPRNTRKPNYLNYNYVVNNFREALNKEVIKNQNFSMFKDVISDVILTYSEEDQQIIMLTFGYEIGTVYSYENASLILNIKQEEIERVSYSCAEECFKFLIKDKSDQEVIKNINR